MTALKGMILRDGGGRDWEVEEAVSEQAARNAIASARCSGSVGSSTYVTDVDKVTRTIAIVHALHSDGTRRKPYEEYR